MDQPLIHVRPAGPTDRDWIADWLRQDDWDVVARRGELLGPLDHPMLIAEREGTPAGLLTYVIDGTACEILTLQAFEPWTGVGTALVDAVRTLARELGCTSLWVTTTNDNVGALRFYQRRGFALHTLRPGAVDEARRTLKPAIPVLGDHGIPLRDEIELSLRL